jgi:iron complex outermembrane recepter protein
LRATANTGFRAPTPGQVNTLNVTTTATPAGTLVPSGTYPVGHPVAVALGAVPLKPEDSQNYTFGIVWAVTENTSITLDYYHIEIDDRLALLNNTIGADELALLIAAGVPDAELLEGSVANFFVNAFDSEIDGIDLAVTSLFPLGGGNLIVDLRHNFNEQKVSSVAPGTINASRVFDLENQVPEHSSVLTFDYAMGRFDGRLRFNYYGGWKTTGGLFSPGDASDQYSYGSSVLVDLEARFRFNDTWMVAVGGENIFDKFPGAEQEPVSQFLGVKHALTSPFGFNGGFWYLRASAQF